MDWDALGRLGMALGLGLLVGLQRERTAPHVAGIRTIALVAALGALLALLPPPHGVWLTAIGFVAVAAALVAGYFVRTRARRAHGLTTLTATLAMYGVGVALALGRTRLAVLVAGSVAVLLQWKRPLHAFVDRIDERSLRAVFRLALIGLVVLPLLPDRDYGPFGVLNPHEIWLLVVLICGLNLAGVVAAEFVGPRANAMLGGVLGGMVSSTAVTVAQARRSRAAPGTSGGAAAAIAIASTVVFARVAIEVTAVAPRHAGAILPPLFAVAAVMAAVAVLGALRWTGDDDEVALPDDRMAFRGAVGFALLYALVLVAVAYAREHWQGSGLYVVAALSGLTDVDAITLSTARLCARDAIEPDRGWRLVLLAQMANLVFKLGVTAVLGARAALWRVAVVFAAGLLASGLVLWLWP
ncbi:MAG: MgtC/SapB family protein [Planctomycetota bacterium]